MFIHNISYSICNTSKRGLEYLDQQRWCPSFWESPAKPLSHHQMTFRWSWWFMKKHKSPTSNIKTNVSYVHVCSCVWTLIAGCFHQTSLHKSSFGQWRGPRVRCTHSSPVPRHVQCLSQTLEGLLSRFLKALPSAIFYAHLYVCRYLLNKKIEVDRIWMIEYVESIKFFFCTCFNVVSDEFHYKKFLNHPGCPPGTPSYSPWRRVRRRGSGAVLFRWSNWWFLMAKS